MIQALIINYIISSLENGVLKRVLISALRNLATKSTNTIDDSIVDLIENALDNKEIDGAVNQAITQALDKVK